MKIRCILDYCKTKACLIGVIPWAIINMCRCDKLLILGYLFVQGVDSKVEEMIYPLQRIDLMKFMPNESIPIRNTREIQENSKNSKNEHFKVALLTD